MHLKKTLTCPVATTSLEIFLKYENPCHFQYGQEYQIEEVIDRKAVTQQILFKINISGIPYTTIF